MARFGALPAGLYGLGRPAPCAAILPAAIEGAYLGLAALEKAARPGPHPRSLRRADSRRRGGRPQRLRVARRGRTPRPRVSVRDTNCILGRFGRTFRKEKSDD